jgi:hypothetical protein
MGYSMATPIKSPKARTRMLRFLKKHWRNWPTVIGSPKQGQYLSDPRGDHLAYDDGKCRIGFDFNAGDGERTYGWCMCAWMALKVGRRVKHEGVKIPYFVYDGHETIKVIVGPPDETGKDRYDELGVLHSGIHARPTPFLTAIGRRILGRIENERKKDREIIRKEIERLDALWAKENP